MGNVAVIMNMEASTSNLKSKWLVIFFLCNWSQLNATDDDKPILVHVMVWY